MNKLKEFLKLIVTSDSGISSKRVCGVLGFIVIIFILIYCSIQGSQAPTIVDTFIWAVCLLLGIDSIVSPFNSKYKNNE